MNRWCAGIFWDCSLETTVPISDRWISTILSLSLHKSKKTLGIRDCSADLNKKSRIYKRQVQYLDQKSKKWSPNRNHVLDYMQKLSMARRDVWKQDNGKWYSWSQDFSRQNKLQTTQHIGDCKNCWTRDKEKTLNIWMMCYSWFLIRETLIKTQPLASSLPHINILTESPSLPCSTSLVFI